MLSVCCCCALVVAERFTFVWLLRLVCVVCVVSSVLMFFFIFLHLCVWQNSIENRTRGTEPTGSCGRERCLPK